MTAANDNFPQAGGIESDPGLPSESKDTPGGQSGPLPPNSVGEKNPRSKFAGKILVNLERHDIDGLARTSRRLGVSRSTIVRMSVRTTVARIDKVFGGDRGD